MSQLHRTDASPPDAPAGAVLAPVRPFPPRRGAKGSFIYRAMTTTDPKLIGIMYMVDLASRSSSWSAG